MAYASNKVTSILIMIMFCSQSLKYLYQYAWQSSNWYKAKYDCNNIFHMWKTCRQVPPPIWTGKQVVCIHLFRAVFITITISFTMGILPVAMWGWASSVISQMIEQDPMYTKFLTMSTWTDAKGGSVRAGVPKCLSQLCRGLTILRTCTLCTWAAVWAEIEAYRSVLQEMPAMEIPRLTPPAAAIIVLLRSASTVVRNYIPSLGKVGWNKRTGVALWECTNIQPFHPPLIDSHTAKCVFVMCCRGRLQQ